MRMMASFLYEKYIEDLARTDLNRGALAETGQNCKAMTLNPEP